MDATFSLGYDLSRLESDGHRAALMAQRQGAEIAKRHRAAAAESAAAFKEMGRGLLDASGVGQFMGAAGLALGMKEFLDYGGHIADMADRLDTSAEAVQHLALIAKSSGSDVETVARALDKVGAALFDVENQKAADAFQRLGLSSAEFIRLAPDQQIIALARAFQQAEKTGQGIAETHDLIGRSASELYPILRANVDELEAMASVKTISDDEIRKLDALGDALEKNKASFMGFLGASVGFGDRFMKSLFSSDFTKTWEEDRIAANQRVDAAEKERAEKAKAREQELTRVREEQEKRRDEVTAKRLAREMELEQKKAEATLMSEAKLAAKEMRAHGRFGAAEKIEKAVKEREAFDRYRAMNPEKGDAWAREMAHREMEADDRLAHPGRIRGYKPPASAYGSALDAMYAKGSLRSEFKFPGLDAMSGKMDRQIRTLEGILASLRE